MTETGQNKPKEPAPKLSRWWIGGPLLVAALLVAVVGGSIWWKHHQFEKERTETPPHVVEDVKLKLLWIPAGTFVMGADDEAEWLLSLKKKYNDVKPAGWSDWKGKRVFPYETPAHKVTLAQGFYLGETEVTQAQWEAVMGSNPSIFKGPNRPVEQLTWADCVEFCRKLTERERTAGRIGPKQVFRLPTEAEWEYACRAGSSGEFCFGDDENRLGEFVWYDGNSRNETHEVGTKRANSWELRDMHGNVCEWCADVWDAKAYGKRSQGWVAEEWTVGLAGSEVKYGGDEDKAKHLPLRVVRGGSFSLTAWSCRSSVRERWWPRGGYGGHGFRLALSPIP